MKKETQTEIINHYAGNCKWLITMGRILGALSAIVGMIPYCLIWKMIKLVLQNKNLSSIFTWSWSAVAILILSMVLYIGALICTHIAAFRVQANMRIQLMEHISKLPLGIFDDEGTGKIRRTVMESTAATETYIAHNIPDQSVAYATPIGLVILMVLFDWRIGVLCLIPALLGFVCMSLMMSKDMQEKMKEYQDSLEVMSNEAVEYVRGIPVVKTFNQSVFSFKRFKKAIDDYASWCITYTKMLTWPMVGFITCINAIFVAIIISACFFNGPNFILNVMYYIIVTPLLTVTLTKMAYAGEQEMTVIDSIQRVNHILEIQPLENEGKETEENDTIQFHHVTYRYPNAAKDAICDLNLTIPAGSHVAFVGPSGGGKTTAANLITRFFDVTDGSITIGNTNIKNISQQHLMNQISYVFQDSRLLKTSILDNLLLANPDATEDEVMHALEKAQCMDIIDKLPAGIHTVIGSKGTYLSGGEQQRIAIARAFLKNSPIIILDEATAFADPDNEAKVQKAFEELTKGKTIIMIAHRLTTVTHADKIFVLQNGSCIESGTHNELMELNKVYHDMFHEYQKSITWKVGI